MKGMAMKIYAVIKQYKDEPPQMSIAYQTKESAQKHVNEIVEACAGQTCYKYYVQESVMVNL
jgi:Ni,Fe-hydrogenase III large subunit